MAAVLAIIDCETTGVYSSDRVVEIAVVLFDHENGEVVDEFDTLVNPMRDTGPVGIHGVTPSMVEAAPSFEEIAGSLAARLDGSVLVAHNLAFDARMLGMEFGRLEHAFDGGEGYCTLQLSGESLEVACRSRGIELGQHHRALSDARAAAQLVTHFRSHLGGALPAEVSQRGLNMSPRTLRRDSGVGREESRISRIMTNATFGESGPVLSYMDMLNWVLDDLVITEEERRQLSVLIDDLGLSPDEVRSAHRSYVRSCIDAAERDSVITQAEHDLVSTVASALGVDDVEVPAVTNRAGSVQIRQGQRVCFTGEVVIGGRRVGRTEVQAAAERAGLLPVENVTKKKCDLLVAADPSSQSGKARKAREYGCPVMSIEEFLNQVALFGVEAGE